MNGLKQFRSNSEGWHGIYYIMGMEIIIWYFSRQKTKLIMVTLEISENSSQLLLRRQGETFITKSNGYSHVTHMHHATIPVNVTD